MNLHDLPKTKRKRTRRVGRGHGSGRGTFAGRGIKGQRARTGGRKGNIRRAIAAQLRSTPKNRGFNSGKPTYATVDLALLEARCKDGETVKLAQLRAWANGARTSRGVKLLGAGPLRKRLTIETNAASAAAAAAVVKAGGSVVRLPR